MRIAIYARVSTDKQSHESQLGELREYCQRREWADVQEFTDTISGSKFTRTGLDGLMGLVRRGKLDAVLCFKLDRLGRSVVHLAQIFAEMEAHNVALIVTSQGIDTTASNPASKFQVQVLSAVAEFERGIIRERVNAGLKAARARGVKLGRKATVHKHAEQAQRLRASGLGVRAISRELKIAVGSVQKLLRGFSAPTQECA